MAIYPVPGAQQIAEVPGPSSGVPTFHPQSTSMLPQNVVLFSVTLEV